MTKEDFYHDFLLIRQLRTPTSKKVRLLSELMTEYENTWQVIGITEEALETFAKHNFNYVSRMGINRSHKVDRCVTYTELLTGELKSCDDWWNYFVENDKTILATSSENKSNSLSRIIDIDVSLGMFKSTGFKWRHNKAEKQMLHNLYNSNDTL